MKLINLKSQLKSALESNKKFISASTEVFMAIDFVESIEFASSSTKNVKPEIRIIDPFEIF